MSDVVLATTESVTTVTVVDDVVQVAVTTNPVEVSSSTAGVQGATGAQGVGYNNVSSTSSIPVTLGLHTWTVANVGAFLPGMRIRAIHTDTPTIWLEGFANVASGTTIIITADKLSGSGTHATWKFASAGEVGATGATGPQGASGVISVTSPVTNSGSASSAVLGLDQTALSLTRSQITDFTSGTVTSASTAQQAGTAVYATTSGTATYATTSGTAVFATNASTAVTISGSITQSQVTNLVTDLAGKASLGSANAFTVGGHTITASTATQVPLGIIPASGQTASTFRVRNSANNADLMSIDSSGQIRTTTLLNPNSFNNSRLAMRDDGIRIDVGVTTNVPLTVRGAASQSANLQEWQNSGGTALARVGSTGDVLASAFSTTLSYVVAGQVNNGGTIRLQKADSAATPPSNQVRIMVLAGTNLNTLKLVAIGPNGTAITILDNLA